MAEDLALPEGFILETKIPEGFILEGEVAPTVQPEVTSEMAQVVSPEEQALFDPFGGTSIPDATGSIKGTIIPELAATTAGGLATAGLPLAKRVPAVGLTFAGTEAIKQIGQQIEKEFGTDVPFVKGEEAPKTSEEAAKKIVAAFFIGGGFELGAFGGGFLLRSLGNKVKPALRPGIEKTFKAVEDFFPENESVTGKLIKQFTGKTIKKSPLLPSQVTESPAIDTLQSIAKRSYLGGGKIIKAEQLTDDILSEALDQSVKGQIGGTGRLQFGEMGMDALEGGIDAFNATAKGMYSSLDDLVRAKYKRDIIKTITPSETGLLDASGRPVMIEGAKKVKSIINGVNITSIKRAAKQMVEPTKAGIRTKEQITLLEEIINKPDIMSFSNAQTLRSDLLAVGRGGPEIIKGKVQGVAKHFSKKLDRSMQEASKNLPREAIPIWREASKFWESGKKSFNSRFIRKLMDSDPEVFLSNTLSGDKGTAIANINKLRSVIFAKDTQGRLVNEGANETWKKFQGFFTEKLLNSSMSDEISRTINGKALLKTMRGFGDETFNALAPKGELNQFREFATALTLNQAKQPGGQGATIFIAMAQAGALGKIIYSGDVDAASVAILGGPAAMAKIMTNPHTSRLLIEGMKPTARWGIKEATKMAARLGTLLAKEGIDAQIVQGSQVEQETP